jgi:hypothetical protein
MPAWARDPNIAMPQMGKMVLEHARVVPGHGFKIWPILSDIADIQWISGVRF